MQKIIFLLAAACSFTEIDKHLLLKMMLYLTFNILYEKMVVKSDFKSHQIRGYQII